MRKLSNTNFNYTNIFRLVLVIRIYIDKKNWITLKHKQQEPLSNKKHRHKSPITGYVQNQVLCQLQKGIYKFLLSLFFLHDFKLKTEVITD